MPRKRTTFSAEFKMKVVLEVLRNEITLVNLASKYNTSIQNIINWKEQFLQNAHIAFENPPSQLHFLSLKKENAKLNKMVNKEQKEKEFVLKTLKNLNSSS